jgi:Transposase DDE domain
MNSKKAVYTPRNWSEYNKSLVNPGSLTLWMSPEVLERWCCDEKTGKKGTSHRYSDKAILCADPISIVLDSIGLKVYGKGE